MESIGGAGLHGRDVAQEGIEQNVEVVHLCVGIAQRDGSQGPLFRSRRVCESLGHLRRGRRGGWTEFAQSVQRSEPHRHDRIGQHANELGAHLSEAVTGLGHPRISGVRGRGLLMAITLTEPVAASAMALAREAGFLVNAVAPDAIRLAPPLILTQAQADTFVDALPGILDAAVPA